MANRRYARELAMQALYAVEVGRHDPAAAVAAVLNDRADADTRVFVRDVVFGTLEHVAESDAAIAPLLREWSLDRLPLLDRTILRMAVFELRRMPQTPRAVVLNEATELANRFSTEKSGRFVNGVLENVATAQA